MKTDPQAPGTRKPAEPSHSDDARQDRDELQPDNPKKWKDVQSAVESELETLHDKARPL